MTGSAAPNPIFSQAPLFPPGMAELFRPVPPPNPHKTRPLFIDGPPLVW